MEPRYIFAGLWFGVAVPVISAIPLPDLVVLLLRTPRPSIRDSKTDELASGSAGALLAEAEIASVRLRRRVSGTIAQVGWTLTIIGWSPFFLNTGPGGCSKELAPSPGSCGPSSRASRSWCSRPADRRPRHPHRLPHLLRHLHWHRPRCVLTVLGNIGEDASSFLIIVILTGAYGTLCASCAGLLIPALFSCQNGCAMSAMTPRSQLRRLWLVIRCWLFGTAIVADADLPFVQPCQLEDTNAIAYHVATALALFWALVWTPSNRARVHRWLGSLGSNASKQQEAAAVAALLGGSGRSAATALRQAEESFRALRLSSLRVEDLTDNKPSPQLFDQTLPVKMGEVGAFVSHSWSDAGALKFGHVEKFAATRGGGDCLIWLDKACIDQSSIDANLASLPVWLRGAAAAGVGRADVRHSAVVRHARPATLLRHASRAIHAHRSPMPLRIGASSSFLRSCAWAARATTSRSACSTPTTHRCASSPSSTPARRSASSRRIASAS